LVHVHLDHLETTGEVPGEALEDRADDAARAAPRRPEVHNDRWRGLCLDLERGVRCVDEPRQRLAAAAAVGRALLARPDLVLSAAVGAGQDRKRTGGLR